VTEAGDHNGSRLSKYSAGATFSASPDAVLEATVHVFRNDWGRALQQGPGVSTSTPLSESGLTEHVTLLVTNAGPQGTAVTVCSTSPRRFGFVARRKNRRNVEHAIRRVGQHLATMQAPGSLP
jgi:hypothetical protein